jgi:hypothetical protein
VKSTSELQNGGAIFALFKGYANCGKSIAAHSFPKTCTFDFDRKIYVIKNYYPDRTFDYCQPKDVIETKQELRELKQNCPYKTIIWDGITKASDLAIKSQIDYRNPESSKPNKDSKMSPAGINMPQIEDYKGELRFIADCMDDLAYINVVHNVNIIVLAHILRTFYQNAKDKTVVDTKSLVSSGQKVGSLIPTLFGERFHFGVKAANPDENKKFICYVEDCTDPETGTGEFAGNSFGLHDSIDWTNKDFYKVFTGKVNKEVTVL